MVSSPETNPTGVWGNFGDSPAIVSVLYGDSITGTGGFNY